MIFQKHFSHRLVKALRFFCVFLLAFQCSFALGETRPSQKQGQKKAAKSTPKPKVAPASRLRGGLIGLGALAAFTAYIAIVETDYLKNKTVGPDPKPESLSTEANTSPSDRVLGWRRSGNNTSEVAPLKNESPIQANPPLKLPQNISSLRDSLISIPQAADNWTHLSQKDRFYLVSKSLFAAKSLLEIGRPTDEHSTVEEQVLITKAIRQARHYSFALTPKSQDQKYYIDFQACQHNRTLFGFFVEDLSVQGAKRIAICQRFFDNALQQANPKAQMDFANRMHMSLILLEHGLPSDRIMELLFPHQFPLNSEILKALSY